MKCPVDGATLVMADRMGIEIDYCPQCRGVWLDRGELDKLIERAAPPVALEEPRAAAGPMGGAAGGPGMGGALPGGLGAGLGGALGAALGGALGSRSGGQGHGGPGYGARGGFGEMGERGYGEMGERGERGERGDWRGDDDDGYRRHKKRKGLLGDIFDF